MTDKPNLTRVWAGTAPGGNVVDPDTVTAGKFAAGWQAEVPPFEYFNFIQKQITEGLAHINEQGIAVWDDVTTYPVGGLAKGSDGNVYKALTSQNDNDPVSDGGTNWDKEPTKADFISEVAGKGAALVSMEGGPSVEVAVLDRVIRATSVAAVEAFTGVQNFQVSLSGADAGIFEFSAADLSTEVSADPDQTNYIAPSSDSTGASGAWVRQTAGSKTPETVADIASLRPHVPYVPVLPMGGQNYDGQTVHPDVIKIEGGFGPELFPFWMAVTPYVYGDDQTENPNVLASYDGFNWVIPDGASNPVSSSPAGGSDFNSDAVLLVVGSNLYIYYRDTISGTTTIRRKVSTDGITWSSASTVTGITSSSPLSPSLLHDGTNYYMWFVKIEDYSIRRFESTDGLAFTNDTTVTLDTLTAGQSPWHLDVIRGGADNDFQMLLNTSNGGGGLAPTELVFYSSVNGISFVKKNEVIEQVYGFENDRFYRGSLLPIDDTNYLVYYSSRADNAAWTTAVFPAQLNSTGTLVPYNPNGDTTMTSRSAVIGSAYIGKLIASDLQVDNAKVTLIPAAGQSITTSSSAIVFNNPPLISNQFLFDPSAPSRITTPDGYTKCIVRIQLNVNSFSSGTGTVGCFLRKNGNSGGVGDAFPALSYLQGADAGLNAYSQSAVLPVVPGDYFEFKAQVSTSSLTLFQSSWFEFEFMK